MPNPVTVLWPASDDAPTSPRSVLRRVRALLASGGTITVAAQGDMRDLPRAHCATRPILPDGGRLVTIMGPVPNDSVGMTALDIVQGLYDGPR